MAGDHKAGHLADHIGRLGLELDECLLVGDVVDAAEQVGTRCVLVTTGMAEPRSSGKRDFP
ncbi:HAD hydrolase-like protein [Streptomyces sp. ISL-100]|uniref:HAD hydrolase-like protein n=1 Tax=Streptomyces sp. ISL-100 TaxID=2819173 RepID=UPI001BEC1047|nr:HAD hydrolase-like protein [Streptomyces sp. ISL-100]MBT2401573.1 HAD hydrolase-like protein [Streptomyces sp. ISL-100]